MYVLDSNILISYLNEDAGVVKELSCLRDLDSRFLISAVTEIEVLSLPKLNVQEVSKLQMFLGTFTVIPLDSQLAKVAADVRRRYGFSLGDSVVIATAQLTSSILITNDKEILRKAREIIKIKSAIS